MVAADRHAHRLRAMRQQFRRLGLHHVHLVELDATGALPFTGGFQRILVDAPCSGTGTLARHPEIRWRLKPQQFPEFHALQVAMVSNAAIHLAKGGHLVYSTCSMEAEENEAVVAEVLGGTSSLRQVTVNDAARALAGHLAPGVEASRLFDANGHFRTVPGDQPADGFFAAIFEKA